MERDGKDRERQRGSAERSEQLPKELSQRQRSFVARSIKKCESRRGLEHGAPTTPTPGSRLKDLQERFEKDFQSIRDINGLDPNVWAKASEQQRLETLRELGRRLALSQNREAYRTYAVDFSEKLTAEQRENTRAETVVVVDGRNAAAGERLADGRYIRIREEFLRDEHPRRAFREAAEENRHAFQLDVLGNENKHSEVDADTRDMWHYGSSVYAEHEKVPELYERNPLERDAKAYAAEMTVRMYGKDRSFS